MTVVLTGFPDFPEEDRGQARDFRIRQICAERRLACHTRPVRVAVVRGPGYRAHKLSGQVLL